VLFGVCGVLFICSCFISDGLGIFLSILRGVVDLRY